MGFRHFSFVTMMIALAAFLLPATARAQIGPNNVPATLVAETLTPKAGATTMLAIRFDPKPTWHGYWQNPGDAGFGGKFLWDVPKGVVAGEPAYPVPTRLIIAELMNHVFEEQHALLIPLTIPAGLAGGTKLVIKVRGDWLGCTDEICVPQGGDMAITLTVGDGAITPASRAQFDGWRAKLPRPLGSAATFAIEGKRVRIGIPLPANAAVTDPWLFAVSENAISYVAKQSISRNGDMIVIETAAAGGAFANFEGVLAIGKDMGLVIKATPGVVPAAGEPITGAATAPSAATLSIILVALGGALLGGLILNIMPCVFPIISLKAISLARAGGDERAARREALAYAAGVIIVCVGLGAALLGLRAGGSAVGWAFQLQEPRVILVLLILVTAIAFNLAGLFEIGGPSLSGSLVTKDGTSGAFWTGALAAFIATPCTGPFMGAALGAALVLPTIAALAIFAGLGLGLALPFLLLGFVPAARAMLPKPGAWMETMRHILSVPMFLTALALVWLLGRQAGVNAMVTGLAVAMIAALILWWFGRRQARGGSGGWAMAAAVVALMIGGATILPRGGDAATAAGSAETITGVIPFSETRLAELRAEGRPVFLYFTADWCLTCKVNEKAAIDRVDTVNAFKAANVAVMVGDWTRADPAITRFLNANGVSGVPLYLYYPKGGSAPQVLPQVLTVATLTALTS
jgi:thiol:disulfide interchange protein/DsbC/DsbD-like thiol-disulfide interchange protein